MSSNSHLHDLRHAALVQQRSDNKEIISSFAVNAQEKAGKTDSTQHAVFYSCPKHPGVTSNTPGKCPTCGMDLNLSKKEEMKTGITKSYACPVHTDMTSVDAGKCPKCSKEMQLSAKEKMKAGVTKSYVCPMHKDQVCDKSGNCPKCGMAMVEKHRNHKH